MQSIIERITTNRDAPAVIFENLKYRKRYSNKDGSEMWIYFNKICEASITL
jgi:hypothetical protein